MMDPKPQTQTQSQNQTPEKKSFFSNKLFIVFLILLVVCFLVALLVGGYFLYKKFVSSSSSENSDNEETQDYEDHKGEYFTTQVPDGWEVIEFVNDESGSDMLVDNQQYIGLIAVHIENPDNQVVFRMEAIDGIGGVDGCTEVYQFDDSSAAYLANGNDPTGSSGTVPSGVDLTGTEFVEYDMIGRALRRISSTLYFDMIDSYDGFNPACGIDKIISFEGVSFRPAGSTEGYTPGYDITLTSGLSETDYLTIDGILQGLFINENISDYEQEDAESVLAEFFIHLRDEEYSEANSFLALSNDQWDFLSGLSDEPAYVTATQKAGMLDDYCNAVQTCLETEIQSSEEVSAGNYVITTKFLQEDGSYYVLGPCCGETEETMPSTDVFEFEVGKVDGVFKVQTTPVYHP